MTHKQSYLVLHICVFIWGFTAILGKLISLNEVWLVWYRMGITSLSLCLIPSLWKNLKAIPKKELFKICSVGILVALHWITFYGAIKASTVSVALTCLATTSFFTSIIEPIIMRTKIIRFNVITGIAIIPAIYIIFYFSGNYSEGILLALVSALLAALFSVINKNFVEKFEPLSITFLELICGFIFISMTLFISGNFNMNVTPIPSQNDLIYLLILSLCCTSIPFILSLYALKKLSAFVANLTINLEPIYGIALAAIIFHEYAYLDWRFYLGAAIILSIVFLNPILLKKFGKI